jgi:hypothetical protein
MVGGDRPCGKAVHLLQRFQPPEQDGKDSLRQINRMRALLMAPRWKNVVNGILVPPARVESCHYLTSATPLSQHSV